jgi:hypothetical protein
MYTLDIPDCKDLCKGSIFDGKLIKLEQYTEFIISDCFYLMNTYMTKMDMNDKLIYINPIINNINTEKYFVLSTNTLYSYNDIPEIIKNANCEGLIFYPQKSGNTIVFINRIQINPVVHKHQTNNIKFNSQPLKIFLDDYFNTLTSRSYNYEKQNKELKYISKTDISDVYDIYNSDRTSRLGIAHIPTIKISHLCKKIITDESLYPVMCTYHHNFKKWIPIEFIGKSCIQ